MDEVLLGSPGRGLGRDLFVPLVGSISYIAILESNPERSNMLNIIRAFLNKNLEVINKDK